MWTFEGASVNEFQLIHDDDWTYTGINTDIGCPTFNIWDLKSIHKRYNIHTYLSMIASNVLHNFIGSEFNLMLDK